MSKKEAQHVYYHTGFDEYFFSESDDLHEEEDRMIHVCKIEKKQDNTFNIYRLLKETGE